jgi:hypothetical protein
VAFVAVALLVALSLSVVAHLGLALPPKTHSPLLGFFPEALELAAVSVGEGGSASQSQLDEVLVEEVLVVPVSVGVQVDVGKGSPVGVFSAAKTSPKRTSPAQTCAEWTSQKPPWPVSAFTQPISEKPSSPAPTWRIWASQEPASPTTAIHGQWNGECPTAILLEPAALAIPSAAMYNAAMYTGVRVR